jgi:urease accessory protein
LAIIMAAEQKLISTAIDSARWRAELQLRFARQGPRTVLVDRKHSGPLVVQRPFYPEGDVCHIYIVHPPGGIAGGDQLQLHATLQSGSHALITTPAATKFYRTLPDRRSSLRQTLHVQSATLEWLPQETIVFRDANTSMATIVQLDSRSHFIGWELTCYGRFAGNEPFDIGRVRQQFEVWIDAEPVFLDHLHIDGGGMSMQARWGLNGHALLGTLLAYPATNEDLDTARIHEHFACTLVDRVLSCRYVGAESDIAKRAFVKLWQSLRPRIIGREAVLPRIWAT